MINLTGDCPSIGWGRYSPVFDPGTILTIGAAGIGAAGSILGGVSAKQQADAQAAALQRQADAERAQGSQEAAQKYADQKTLMGNEIAAAAASGGGASDPTILDIYGDTAAKGYQQRQTIVANSENVARGDEESAANAKASGKSALIGGFIDAGSSLLSGASKAYTNYGSKFMPKIAPAAGGMSGWVDPYQSYLQSLAR